MYDPVVGQWMTPSWERLATKLTTPTDVFIYRFQNNDPINPKTSVKYMTDLNSWLQVYGYDLRNMLGSDYIGRLVYKPQATVTSKQLAPDFGVMSGLECIVDKVFAIFITFSILFAKKSINFLSFPLVIYDQFFLLINSNNVINKNFLHLVPDK